MSENVPSVREAQDLALLSEQQVVLVKQTIAKGATDQELHMFLEVAHASGLNPFRREIYFLKFTMRDGTTKVAMPVGIDGLRRKAAESGDYAGQVGPQWCGPDGEWKDIWLPKDPKERPVACRVGVLRHGNPIPTWGIVKASEFAKDTRWWREMFCHMMAKTAESHALRKAAPGLIAKIEATGAQVIDAEYIIAQTEHLERQKALPQQTLPGDLEEELYGQGAEPVGEAEGGEEESEGDKKQEPVEWTKADVARFQQAVTERELSSTEWRNLLDLPVTAQKTALQELGPVGTVISLLQAAFAKAVAGESVGQTKLGF